jgi:hypothetical protein
MLYLTFKKYHLKINIMANKSQKAVEEDLNSKLTIRDFAKNKENPFLKEAIAKIENNIVKKFKKTSGTSKNAILHAVNSDGEIIGHTSFIQQIEVDEEKFTKIYLSQFSSFFDLDKGAIKVFGYIMTILQPKKDQFTFILEDCMEYTGYKSHKSIHDGLAGLLKAEIIARGSREIFYFINPMVAFNGDRVTFSKTYVKNQSKRNLNPNQTNLLDEFE